MTGRNSNKPLAKSPPKGKYCYFERTYWLLYIFKRLKTLMPNIRFSTCVCVLSQKSEVCLGPLDPELEYFNTGGLQFYQIYKEQFNLLNYFFVLFSCSLNLFCVGIL